MRKITHAARVVYGNNGTLSIGRKMTEKEIEEISSLPLEETEWLLGFDPYTHVVRDPTSTFDKSYAVGTEGEE